MKQFREHINTKIKEHELICKLARHAYSEYNIKKDRNDFFSRIKQINADQLFLDISNNPNMNVVILTIDCLRDSQLSYNQYYRDTTPFIDSIKGSKFKAITSACWTYPSVASILTGLYPHNHGAILTGKLKNVENPLKLTKIKNDKLTLFELFYILGYRIYFRTAIDVAFYPLKGRVIPSKIPDIHHNNAEDLLDDLKRWISKRGNKPFFAYVQLGDLHEPLNPPAGFRDFFGEVKNCPNINSWDFKRREEQIGGRFQEYKENRITLYDNALKYVDYSIEGFYSFLKNSGLIDSTILIITADHGEEFWEHARLEAKNFYDPRGFCGVGHGHNVFNELIEVPLILSNPKLPNKKYDKLVSTTDISPTILDLLEVKHKLSFDGVNVFKSSEKRALINEATGYGYEKKALYIGGFKLIYSKHDEIAWVFDLKKDPEEKNPITDDELVRIFINKLNKMLTAKEALKVLR
ncbi:MAG: Sulfatase [Methanothrix harundinacea]|jgi:arylsulfatase A-like enzyme|uniref:Sulfatase n=1 Tax=Methanothrix harundinacea TaxID=301375 RepID=A0A101FSI1_9EURY|nr:MAG: Sulfatase [Methanothrix harundinacea]